MLTRQQLQRIAQRHGIGLQAQERDYVQHLYLSALYARGQFLLFKGGTALRVLYRLPRYSEDLDFNATLSLEDTRILYQQSAMDLQRFGIAAACRNEWQSDVGFSFDLSFQGPLYDGRNRTKGKVRVDTNLRLEKVEVDRKLVTCEYDDIVPFLLTALNQEHLFAEKVRALLIRGKARDVYDLWYLLEQGLSPNPELIKTKLMPYEIQYDQRLFQEQMRLLETSWRHDLQALVAQVPEFEMARKRILQAFPEVLPL